MVCHSSAYLFTCLDIYKIIKNKGPATRLKGNEMSFDIITSKYPGLGPVPDQDVQGPDKPSEPTEDKPFWRDSPDIVALHEYLAANRDAGATVVLSLDNEPAVRFEPGLSQTDSPERWDKARHVLALFSLALPDIKHLLKFGLIEIPRGWSAEGSPLVRGSFPGP